mmetsp:Transcript_49388/g.152322  ORF Transcript_49388/g.152322 Transcript_49388/m.152322 type:complete len:302 (+) Transcript_49388:299-1204(+)
MSESPVHAPAPPAFAPGKGSTGGAFDEPPAGMSAKERSGGAAGAALGWAPRLLDSDGLLSSRARAPPPPPPGSAARPLAAVGASPLASRPGLGTSMETTGPNFSASSRMSAQISMYPFSSRKSSELTMFFKYTTLLATTRAPSFWTLATSPISMTSSGFFTLSFFAPSSRPSSAARACCCVIMSAYSKKATPTDLPSSSFCSAKNFNWPNVIRSSRIRSSVTNVGMFTKHNRWSMADTMAACPGWPGKPGSASCPGRMAPCCAIISPSDGVPPEPTPGSASWPLDIPGSARDPAPADSGPV